jgi:hypothetical protein
MQKDVSRCRKMRNIKVSPETIAIFQVQLELFRKKFGRNPGPEDPVFFDPKCDVPTPILKSELKESLRKACEKTGVDYSRALVSFGFNNA